MRACYLLSLLFFACLSSLSLSSSLVLAEPENQLEQEAVSYFSPADEFEKVEVRAEGKVVILSGFVNSDALRQEAQKRAETVPGVEEVRNYILVDPQSQSIKGFTLFTPEERDKLRKLIVAITSFLAINISLILVLSTASLLSLIYYLTRVEANRSKQLAEQRAKAVEENEASKEKKAAMVLELPTPSFSSPRERLVANESNERQVGML